MRRNHKNLLLAAAVASVSSAALAQQIPIPRVEAMPSIPFNYQYKDYAATIAGYDATTFNPTATYQYPIFWWDNTSLNGVTGGFGIPSYVGFPGQNSSQPTNYEGVNTMGAVLGASVAGIDKQAQVINGTTYDFVWMSSKFFNSGNGENVVLNRINTSTGQSFWYETFPQIQWYSLSSMYYSRYSGDIIKKSRLDNIITTSANRWHSAINVMAGGSGTATPNFNHTAFKMTTQTPIDNGAWTEPDAAAAVGLMQYWAYKKTGSATYLSDAQRCIQFLEDRPVNQNPNYELSMPFGALAAARLNAEQNGNYDVAKFVNWWFDPTSVVRGSGWGILADSRWNGFGAAGLAAGTTDDYAFAMDSWASTAGLVPMVRYDQRFARGIGKWMLNLVNSSRLFYKETLPANQQSSGDWNDAPSNYWAYEGVKRDDNGLSPYMKGDAHEYWGSATDFAYGSGFAGYLGGIVKPTSDDKILRLDLRVMDFYSDANARPTYLVYNPYTTRKDIQVDVGPSPVDIYDSVSGKVLATNVSGLVTIPLPADRARVLVYCPANSTFTDNGKQVKIGTIVVDYRSPELNRAYWDLNGTTAGAGSATPSGTWDASALWGNSAGTLTTTAFPAGKVAAFSAGADATGSYTVTVSGTQAISGLWFKNGAVTLTGGTLNLASDSTLTAAAGTHTVNSTISGSNKLLKDGPGTVILGAANTYTGITSIEEGILKLANASALANSTVDVNVHNGLDLNGLSAIVGGLSGSGNLAISGSSLTIGSNNADTTYTGSLSGSGQLIKTGSGLSILAGSANSYTGNTTINSGLVRFSGAGSIPTSGFILLSSGAYAGADAAAWGADVNNFLSRFNKSSAAGTVGIESDLTNIDLSGFNGLARLGSSSVATLSGSFTPQSSSYRLGGGGGTLTVASTLVDNGIIPRNVDVGVSGSLPGATIILTGNNTYTGGTTISAGTLSISDVANLGAASGALTINGGTLRVTGTSLSAPGRTITWGASGGGFDIASAANTFTVTQNLSAGGALTKSGLGELRLTGSNSFSALNINAGTVSAGSNAALGSGSISLAQSTTLAPVNSFSTSKTINFNASANVNVAAATNLTFTGTINIANDAELIKTGTGTLTLAGNTVTSGAVTLRQGTLVAGSNSPWGNSNSTQHLLVGDPLSADDENLAVYFSSGVNVTYGRIFFKPYALNGTKTIGGTFNSGTANFNSFIHVTSPGMTLQLTSAAGGQVNFNAGFLGDDSASPGGKSTNLLKVGPGIVRIAPGGAPTSSYFTGVTTVSNGTLLLGGNDTNTDYNCVLGYSPFTRAVQIGNANTQPTDNLGLLIDGAYTINHNINVNNYGNTVTLGGNTSTAGKFGGAVALARDVTLTTATSSTVTFAGTISGTGGITKIGNGTALLAAANTYSGISNIQSGVVRLGDPLALQNSTANVLVNNGLDLNGLSATLGGLAGTGNLTNTGASLTVGANNASTSYSGAIPGSANLLKLGTGSLTLSGGSAYTGTTTVRDGALVLAASTINNSAGPLGNNQTIITLADSSTPAPSTVSILASLPGMDMGRRIALGSANGAKVLGGVNTTGTATFSNYIDDLVAGSQTLQLTAAAGGTVHFTAGFLDYANTLNLLKTGPGTVRLSAGGIDTANNTYSGATTIRAGTLLLANNDTSLATQTVLGNSPNTTAVQLGDSASASSDIALLIDGPYRINHNLSANNYGSSITIGGLSAASSTFAGNLALSRNVNLTAAAGGTVDFLGAITGSGKSITKTGPGVVRLSGTNTYSGGTTINDGKLSVTAAAAPANRPLIVNAGTYELVAGNSTLYLSTLSVAPGAKLDLNDNDLVVNTAAFTTIRDLVFTGYSGSPDPSKTGIISTTAQSAGNTILAVLDNALVGASDWPLGSGQTISPSAIIGKYTYFGDANLDGQVTADDYAILDGNLNTTPPPGIAWLSGDANMDGAVSSDDYAILDSALGSGVGNPLAPQSVSAVPEPASLALLAIGAGLLFQRRRHRRT